MDPNLKLKMTSLSDSQNGQRRVNQSN